MLQPLDEILDVRQRALVELLDPALLDQERGIRRVVGHHDDVAADRLAVRERALDLAEELRVVVDVLDVLHLDPRALREQVEGWMPLRLLVDVDVERPVREDERLGERLLRRAFGEARQESGDRESGAAGERAA